MSGIAIILPGCDFSVKNIGKVTFLEDANLTGITISGSDTVSDLSSQYSVGYAPANTSQRGVKWSIVSGSQYATIDVNTGLLTVLSGANNSSVTIKATSAIDNTITATKSITVTYIEVPILLTALSIQGDASPHGATSQYTVGYTPIDTTQQGVVWSITSGSSYATIDANTGLLTILSGTNALVTIKATSAIDNTITATKIISVTYIVAGWAFGLTETLLSSATFSTSVSVRYFYFGGSASSYGNIFSGRTISKIRLYAKSLGSFDIGYRTNDGAFTKLETIAISSYGLQEITPSSNISIPSDAFLALNNSTTDLLAAFDGLSNAPTFTDKYGLNFYYNNKWTSLPYYVPAIDFLI